MVISGGNPKVKPPRVIVPSGVVTLTLPEEPSPTTADISVGETTVNELAGVFPKLTAVASENFVPVITTVVPLIAEAGKNDFIVGGVV